MGTNGTIPWGSQSADWFTRVSQGDFPGYSSVHKFGRNDAVPSASWEMVDIRSSSSAFIDSASVVRIAAGGNVNDTAAGTNAREVTVQGLDAEGNSIEEAIATNGSSVSSDTSASFFRVHRAWVSSCGAYSATNAGSITVETSQPSPDTLIVIDADYGQSEHAIYTVPTGKKALVHSVFVTIDSGKSASVRMRYRKNSLDTTAPVNAVRTFASWTGLDVPVPNVPQSPWGPFDELTDIWAEAQGTGGAGAAVTVDFEMILYDA